jgi:hypothetical protein
LEVDEGVLVPVFIPKAITIEGFQFKVFIVE